MVKREKLKFLTISTYFIYSALVFVMLYGYWNFSNTRELFNNSSNLNDVKSEISILNSELFEITFYTLYTENLDIINKHFSLSQEILHQIDLIKDESIKKVFTKLNLESRNIEQQIFHYLKNKKISKAQKLFYSERYNLNHAYFENEIENFKRNSEEHYFNAKIVLGLKKIVMKQNYLLKIFNETKEGFWTEELLKANIKVKSLLNTPFSKSDKYLESVSNNIDLLNNEQKEIHHKVLNMIDKKDFENATTLLNSNDYLRNKINLRKEVFEIEKITSQIYDRSQRNLLFINLLYIFSPLIILVSLFIVNKQINQSYIDWNKKIISKNLLLFEEQEKLKIIINNSIDGIATLSHEGKITEVNNTFLSLFACKKSSDVLNKSILMLFNNEKDNTTKLKFEDLIEEIKIKKEFSFYTLNGGVFPAWVNISQLKKGPRPTYSLSIKNLSQLNEQQKRNRRLASTIDNSSDAMIILGPNYKIEYSNYAAFQMFGLKNASGLSLNKFFSEASTKKFNKVLFKHPDREVLEEIELSNIENKRTFCSVIISSNRSSSNGPIDSYTISIQDLTREKEFKSQLDMEKAKSLYNSKMASLGEMAAGIAHEVNNPLSIISGYSQLIQFQAQEDKLQSNELLEITSQINKVVCRISSIVKSLKSFSRDGSQDPFSKSSLKGVVEETLGFSYEKLVKLGVKTNTQYEHDLFGKRSIIPPVLSKSFFC